MQSITRYIVTALIAMTSWAGDADATCAAPQGGTVREGAAWVARDGCNVCQCTSHGVECSTWQQCSSINHLGSYGDPLCVYAHSGGTYRVGQQWTAQDGCNRCVCTVQGMNCTAKACSQAGFAQPKPDGSNIGFMDCPYNGRVYRYQDQFLADDGCNTCYCIMPGNYATFPACTSTPCDLIG